MIPFAKQFTFLFFGPVWCYNARTGVGMRRVGYNPFTDLCYVRRSQFGTVQDFIYIERVAFERACQEAE